MSISIRSTDTTSTASSSSKLYSSSTASTSNIQSQMEPKVDTFVSSQVNKKVLIAVCDSLKARNTAQNYIQGELRLEEYKNAFKEEFYHSLNFNVERGFTTTQNKEDVFKILEATYNGFKSSAISASLIECNNEGLDLHGDEARKGVYYNADYYYVCEDMKSALEECYLEISKELSLDQAEVPKTTQHDNFNDLWSLTFGGKCKFDAKSAGAPPEDFQMYYKPQKYPASDFQNGVTYRLIAGCNTTVDGNSGVMYITLPKYLPLLNQNSKINTALLQSLLSKNNTQTDTTSYDISSLISGYAGNSIEEQFASFAIENCVNEQVGFIKASCEDWTMEADIPFRTLTNTYYYNGSDLISSNSEDNGSFYLNNFTFAKSHIPERFKRQ